MPTRQLNLKALEREDARVEAFVAALEGRVNRRSADDGRDAGEAHAWTTDGFTASGKSVAKVEPVANGWAPQFTASGKMQGKTDVTAA